jgi:hypothetical protein
VLLASKVNGAETDIGGKLLEAAETSTTSDCPDRVNGAERVLWAISWNDIIWYEEQATPMPPIDG